MKYCLGAPFVESRPLTEGERDLLTQCLETARKRRWIWVVVAWAATPVGLVCLALSASLLPDGGGGVGFFFVIVWMVVLAVGICFAIDAKSRYKLLRTSLQAGNVEVFDYPVWEGIPDEVARTSGSPLLRVPETGLLLNSLDPRKPTLNTASATAAVRPPRMPRASDRMHPPRIEMVSERILEQRELSNEELEDLKRLTKRLGGIEWYRVLFPIYFIVGVFAYASKPRTAGNVAHELFFSAVVALYAFYLGHRWTMRRKLTEDYRGRMVLRVNRHHQAAEILPNSRYVWTLNGEPSEDRRIGERPKSV